MTNEERRTDSAPPFALGHSVHLFAPGTRVGRRYEIRDVLGTGGSAVVYGVFDRELGREGALKVLRSDRMSEAMLTRFRREVAVAREADSPRLVKIWDIGSAGETVFLAMERVDGESLRERILRGPLPVEDAVRIGCEILEALLVLHRLGIIHRDIKPGNVLIAEAGAVKLADFGLALRLESDESRATATGIVVGTFEYLSPEQALSRDLDARSDLYSFGVVLYEMLAGDVPHRGLSSLGTLVAQLREETPDVRSKRPEAPAWLAALLARLLEKEPCDRYATADDVLRDLAAGRPPVRRLRKRSRLGVAAIVAGAALLFLAVLNFWPRDHARFARLSIEPEEDAVASDAGGEILWRRKDISYARQAAVGQFSRGGPRQIAAVLDGKGLYDAESIRELSFLDAETGRVSWKMRLPDGGQYFPGFSDKFFAGLVWTGDLDGDGVDEVVVTYTHHPFFPSYTVLCDTLRKTARIVFLASGHHRPVAAVDLDGDGKKELILMGPSNRLGWNIGIAALRLFEASSFPNPVPIPAATPDRFVPEGSGGLLWYALLPDRGGGEASSTFRWDGERHLFEVSAGPAAKELLDTSGFFQSDRSLFPTKERAASRQLAYEHLREGVRLLDAGFPAEAVAEGTESRAEAERAGDRTLIDWTGRFRSRALVAAGRSAKAAAAFEALSASSGSPANVAFEAAHAFHLAGDLGRAVSWYRRGLGRGGEFERGRAKQEFLEGLVLALAEGGQTDKALAEVDRYQSLYPQMGVAIAQFHAFPLWRAGRPFDLPPPSIEGEPDLLRAWNLEYRAAKAEGPERLLADLEREEARASGSRYLLGSLKADLLGRLGKRDDALVAAREAWDSMLKSLPTDVAARAHLALVGERLAAAASAAGHPDEARATRGEVARLQRSRRH